MKAAVETFDLAAASDGELAAVHAVGAESERAAGVADVLIPPPAQGVLDLRHPPANVARHAFVVRDGGRIVGAAEVEWEDAPSNRDHVSLWVDVLPTHRRHGRGTALMTAAVEHARATYAPRLLDVEARRDNPAVTAFLARFGFEARRTSPRNVLWTGELDRKLLDGWVERARERAHDYELVTWDGPVPDAHRDAFLDLWHVMNTAPREDMEWDDEIITPARAEAWDAHWVARGITPWTVVARHRPSGRFAGFTVVTVHRHWPAVAEQEDTGVLPEHRNHGVGRWLKAANALRLLDERPEVSALTTWNAGSNEPMLAINHAMGFAPIEWWAEWQAPA